MTTASVFFIVGSTSLSTFLLYKLFVGALFYPTTPISFLGIRFQGILPGFRKKIASNAGKWLKEEVFPRLQLEKKLGAPENIEKLLPLIEEHVDEFLQHKLTQQMPMISMFVGEKMLGKLKETFMQEIAAMLPKLLQSFGQNLQEQVDLSSLIAKISDEYPDAKLKQLIKNKFRKQLNTGAIIAILLGSIAGLLQVAILNYLN
jgi:uncharacterized membrane protein YheB (UPF0754 family)